MVHIAINVIHKNSKIKRQKRFISRENFISSLCLHTAPKQTKGSGTLGGKEF